MTGKINMTPRYKKKKEGVLAKYSDAEKGKIAKERTVIFSNEVTSKNGLFPWIGIIVCC